MPITEWIVLRLIHLINSYKRLVPGYDAPVNMTWTASSANRTSLIRIPYKRGNKTRIELRNPDATCNPYLALALCIAAGLDGIEEEMLPPKQLSMQQADDNENAERFDTLPQTLGQAITAFTKDPLVKKVLGDDVYAKFLEAKESEWKRFRSCVTQWEMNEYLGKY